MPAHTTTQRVRRPVTVVDVMKETLRIVFTPSLSNSPSGSPNTNLGSRMTPNSFASTRRAPSNTGRLPSTTRQVSSTSTTATTNAAAHVDSTAQPASADTAARPRRTQGPHPTALPTENFYERFPRAVGPLANVLVVTREDYHLLLLIAQRITVVKNRWERNIREGRLSEEDLAKGGFLVYRPNSVNAQYFKMLSTAAEVYGSSTYVRASTKMR